jgi:phage tail-like protein
MSDPGTGFKFYVKIDGFDLGSFTAIDGLSAEYEVEQYQEGGQNGFVHQLPGRAKFTNIKVTRALDRAINSKVSLASWFSAMMPGRHCPDRNGVVSAYDGNNKVVAEWHLRAVIPIKYTGPSFSVDGSQVATESLELAHQGFLDLGN